jgi:hypothetical protein
MRGRLLLGSVFGVALASLACGLLGDGEAALKKQEAFAERACNCPDVACLQKVQQAQAKWIEDHGDELVAAGMADSERLQAAVDKTAKCAERIARAQANGEPASTPSEQPAKSGGGKGRKGKKKR